MANYRPTYAEDGTDYSTLTLPGYVDGNNIYGPASDNKCVNGIDPSKGYGGYGVEFKFLRYGNLVERRNTDYCAGGIGKCKKIICQRYQNVRGLEECCKGTASPLPHSTCAMIYQDPTSAVCSGTMQEFCKEGTNIFDNSRCITWAAVNPELADIARGTICTGPGGLDRPACREWCKTTGKCDVVAQTWCDSNPAHEFCSCLKSTTIRPDCYDNNCNNTGYKPSSMRTGTDCGTLMNCVQNFGVSDGASNNQVTAEMIQSCENKTDSSTPKETPEDIPSQTEIPAPKEIASVDLGQLLGEPSDEYDDSNNLFGEEKNKYTAAIIFVIVFMVCLLGVGIFGIIRALTKKPKPQYHMQGNILYS